MTFYKPLAESVKDGKTITAWEKTEKFSSVPSYEITVSVDGITHDVIRTARTTWKKKYSEMIK